MRLNGWQISLIREGHDASIAFRNQSDACGYALGTLLFLSVPRGAVAKRRHVRRGQLGMLGNSFRDPECCNKTACTKKMGRIKGQMTVNMHINRKPVPLKALLLELTCVHLLGKILFPFFTSLVSTRVSKHVQAAS